MRDTTTWTLRKANGSTFGPVELPELRKWAAEGRVVAGNEASRDGRTWMPVEEMPDLEMNWMAHRADGKISGPFNIRAIPALLHHGVLELDTRLEHVSNGRELMVPDVLEELGIELPDTASHDDPDTEDEPDDGQEQHVNQTLTDQIDSLRCQLEEEQLLASQTQEALQQRITELEASLQEALQEVAPLQRALADAQKQLDVLAGSTDSRDAALAKLEKAHQALQEACDAAVVDRDAARAECEELSETATSLRDQLARAQEALDETGNRLDQVNTEFAADLETARADAEHARLEASAAREERDTLKVRCEEMATRTASLETVRAEEQQRIAEQTERAKAKLHELQDQIIFMRKNNASIQSEMERLRLRFSRLLKLSLIGFGAVLLGLAMTALLSSREEVQTATTTGAAATEGPRVATPPPAASDSPAASAAAAVTTTRVLPPDAVDLPPEDASGADVLPPPVVPWPTISSSKVTVRAGAHEHAVVFKEQVFASLARIGPAGEKVLAEVARELKPALGSFTLIVEGHTDNDPVRGIGGYADNQALGQARADAARAYLITACGLPAARIKAVSMGETQPPFPNDTAENKRRNRTVVLKLRRQ